MKRATAAIVFMILGCAARPTVDPTSTNSLLMEAQALLEEGHKLKEAGKYAQAVPLVERALELRESILGEMHLEVANCLNFLGDTHRRLGNHSRAESLLQRALTIRKTGLDQDHPDVALSLDNLANLYVNQGFYSRAEPLHKRALAIREVTFGKSHPDVASSLNNLATLYSHQGLYAQAESLYKRALAIREATLGRSHRDVASSLNDLALLYSTQGLYDQAELLYERARAIWESVLGEKHPHFALLLNNLATLYRERGLYSRAEQLYKQALVIQEVSLGENHPNVALLLNNLAILYDDQGLYARAEPLHKRALAIWEAALGKNHPNVAGSLTNLANLYYSQGLLDRAEPLHKQALEIAEATLGKNHSQVAIPLINLANLYLQQEAYALAAPHYERALRIGEMAFGEEHPNVALSLNNLAALYHAQGHYTLAEPLYERALRIRESTLSKSHPHVATSLHNLANLYANQGHYARAKLLYERALAIRESTLGENHPDVALLLNSIARLHLAHDNLTEALPLFTRAFAISEEHLRQEVFGFSEVRLASLLRLLREDEERLYSLARAHLNDARVRHLALSTSLLRKGRSVEELADTSRIIFRSLANADREAFERLRALRTQFSVLSLAGPGSLSSTDYQNRLKELAATASALEEYLSKRSAPLRAISALPTPDKIITHVVKALPKDGALIEFIVYRDSPLAPRPATPSLKSPGQLRYLALLLLADGLTHAVDLGPAEPIDTAALRLHDAFARQSASYEPAAQALYKLVFRPLLPYLGKAQRLFLSPDGQLALIPFAALHDGSRFLVDALDITYVTSGKDLLPRVEDAAPARSVVVLADPDFDSSPAPSTADHPAPALAARSISLDHFFSSRSVPQPDTSWEQLPGTRREAETIQRLIPQAQLLLGPSATKRALLTLKTPGVLHIATHGFFLEDAATPATTTRAVGHFGALGEAGPGQRPPDPLLRSGLVLAGAGARPVQATPHSREDSIVTALELAGLDLWGTQLVVLSACDTGRGDIKLGQGVYGMRRALVVAGAESLVTTLWKVNDKTSHELIERYYSNLLAGEDRAEALRTAMRALRQKHPHPYFWAPFITIGQDGRLRNLMPN